MKLDRFLAERSPQWLELESLLARAGPTGQRLTSAELRHFGQLYRNVASDLAVARRRFPGSPGEQRLAHLVASSYGVVYARVAREDSMRTFLGRTLWTRIYDSRRMLVLSFVVMVAAIVGGVAWALTDPTTASTLLPGVQPRAHNHGGFYGVSLTARGGLAVAIFTNNILVSCTALLGGFTFGVLTAYMLAYNGLILGVLGALEWRVGGFTSFLRLVVPHGLLELSCIALAGAAGFTIARALIDPGWRTRRDALARLTPAVAACTVGVIIFLVVAGLTEGFITPWDLPTVPAVALGVALAGAFWTAVIWRGRSSSPRTPLTRERVL